MRIRRVEEHKFGLNERTFMWSATTPEEAAVASTSNGATPSETAVANETSPGGGRNASCDLSPPSIPLKYTPHDAWTDVGSCATLRA